MNLAILRYLNIALAQTDEYLGVYLIAKRDVARASVNGLSKVMVYPSYGLQ